VFIARTKASGDIPSQRDGIAQMSESQSVPTPVKGRNSVPSFRRKNELIEFKSGGIGA
jgi:hypothetical protein